MILPKKFKVGGTSYYEVKRDKRTYWYKRKTGGKLKYVGKLPPTVKGAISHLLAKRERLTKAIRRHERTARTLRHLLEGKRIAKKAREDLLREEPWAQLCFIECQKAFEKAGFGPNIATRQTGGVGTPQGPPATAGQGANESEQQ